MKNLLLEKQSKGLVVNNQRICISAIFAEAVEREILKVNPAHNLGKIFKSRLAKKNVQILSKEQVAAFLEVVQQEKPQYYALWLTAFRTGMRLGELLGLSWDCVNFDTRQITICRSYSHKHWDSPKSHKIRHVDMSDSYIMFCGGVIKSMISA